MILITGATGTVGRYVVKQLSAKRKQVRALVRNPRKAQWLAAPNVEFVQGDFEDITSLERALAGIDCAFLLTPTSSNRIAQEANFLKATKKTKIKHIVRLSILGAKSNSPSRIMCRHGEADKQLEESGIAFTILQPSYFMQNLLWYAETIKTQGVFHASLPETTKHSHVDARDIAAVAVALLIEKKQKNQVYRITGPEALTYKEMMITLSELLDKPVRYDSSPRNYAKSLEDWGLDINEVLELDRCVAQGVGDGAIITSTIAEVAKKEPILFKQFVKDHLRAFQDK